MRPPSAWFSTGAGEDSAEVRRDLITRLQGLGLSEAPFFVVPDAGPHEGLLSGDGVSELRDWLQLLAGRHRAAGLVRRTGRGVWSTLRADLERLADDVDAQNAVARGAGENLPGAEADRH